MNPGSPGFLRETLHDLKQPLNVISLTVGNLRNRAGDQGLSLDPDYLFDKLARIEQQVDRASSMIEALMAAFPRGDGPSQPHAPEA